LHKIKTVGDSIRDLKAKKAAKVVPYDTELTNHVLIIVYFDKDAIDKEVKTLLELKAEYKKVTGEDWRPDAQPPANSYAQIAQVCLFDRFIL
jgi:bifunctional glutamyl/prolyl-tRNA synthetase